MVKTEYLSLAPASYGALSAAGLCIAAGATVIVIGFVGCCGAWIQSRCLLLTVSLYSSVTSSLTPLNWFYLVFRLRPAGFYGGNDRWNTGISLQGRGETNSYCK